MKSWGLNDIPKGTLFVWNRRPGSSRKVPQDWKVNRMLTRYQRRVYGECARNTYVLEKQ